MLVTKRAVTTSAGINLQLRNMSGEQIEFTKLEVGSGIYSPEEVTEEALRGRTALKSKKQQFGISSLEISSDNTTLILSCLITNAELKEGYTIRELGLYAQIKNQPDTEQLVSISLAEIEDAIPAYNGETESRILMKYQFTVSDSDTVSLSYEHDPVALAEDVEKKYAETTKRIRELEEQREQIKEELNEEFDSLSENITKLFPDLPVPTVEDAGKTLQIDEEGKAVWVDSLLTSFPEFTPKTTTFNADGSITEKLYDADDVLQATKTTTFNADGSITEKLYDADEKLLATKTTTFNADGSITETVI